MTTRTGAGLFDRVVCGVDASAAGALAAKVAGVVTDPHGSLSLVTANDTSIAVPVRGAMASILEELELEAIDARQRGRTEAASLHPLESKLVEGDPVQALLAEIERVDASLLVVGSHGVSLATGLALGAVSTRLLHDAPCSVLVARGAVDPGRWPLRIVAGVDGSDGSAAAFGAASELADRFDAELRAIVPAGDDRVDIGSARRIAPMLEEHGRRALDLLEAASAVSDLIVVGSSGLRGVKPLGSLSERIAHEAQCSVLVVRASQP